MTILCPDVSEFQSSATAPDWAGIKAKNGGGWHYQGRLR